MMPEPIRPYTSKDYDAVAEMMNRLQQHFVTVDQAHEVRAFASIAEANAYVDQALQDVRTMNGVCFVAEIDNVVVGFVQGVIVPPSKDVMHDLGHLPSSDGWIGLLYVDPQYRGRGLGRKLIDTIKQHFVQKGCTKMRLKVLPENTKTIEIYRRYGFLPTDVEMTFSL